MNYTLTGVLGLVLGLAAAAGADEVEWKASAVVPRPAEPVREDAPGPLVAPQPSERLSAPAEPLPLPKDSPKPEELSPPRPLPPQPPVAPKAVALRTLELVSEDCPGFEAA